MILTIIGLILIAIILLFGILAIKESCGELISLLCLGIIIISLALICYDFQTVPTAIDVYQGKTQLRIIYNGEVPVDTTVIYK